MSMKRLVLAGMLSATALAFVGVSPTAVMADEVKGATISVTDEGSWIEFMAADGNMVKSKISSSRTNLTIGGEEAKRTKLKAGMICDITYVMKGERNEPSMVSCM